MKMVKSQKNIMKLILFIMGVFPCFLLSLSSPILANSVINESKSTNLVDTHRNEIKIDTFKLLDIFIGDYCSFDPYGRLIDSEKINKMDNQGLKTGLWVLENDDFLTLQYYMQGKKNGLCIQYGKIKDKNSHYHFRLEYIINYRDGKYISPIIVYRENALPSWIITDIETIEDDSDSTPAWMKLCEGPIYKGVAMTYTTNPYYRIERIYTLYFLTEFEVDVEYVGEYIILDENGDIKEKRVYPATP